MAALFALLHGIYLATAVAAFHHVATRRFLAFIVSCGITVWIFGGLNLAFDHSPKWIIERFFTDDSPTLGGAEISTTIVSLSKYSAVSTSQGWLNMETLSPDDHAVHARNIVLGDKGVVKDISIRIFEFSVGDTTGGRYTLVMAVVKGSNASQSSVTRYSTELGPINSHSIRIRIYPSGGNRTQAMPNGQSGEEVMSPGGLHIGTVGKSGWGYAVASFKVTK